MILAGYFRTIHKVSSTRPELMARVGSRSCSGSRWIREERLKAIAIEVGPRPIYRVRESDFRAFVRAYVRGFEQERNVRNARNANVTPAPTTEFASRMSTKLSAFVGPRLSTMEGLEEAGIMQTVEDDATGMGYYGHTPAWATLINAGRMYLLDPGEVAVRCPHEEMQNALTVASLDERGRRLPVTSRGLLLEPAPRSCRTKPPDVVWGVPRTATRGVSR